MSQRQTGPGLAAAAFSFLCWGMLPLYWRLLDGVAALEISCHRVVWSGALTGLLLLALGRAGEVRKALSSRRDLGLLAVSSAMIGVNWVLYIWAVNNGHVLDASLGYYLNPLVNVVLGMAVFRERLNRPQSVAVGLAACGVAVQFVGAGSLPWIALSLAVSFGIYGMVRKLTAVESLPGLFVETACLGLPAAGYLFWRAAQGVGGMGSGGLALDLLLVGAGAVTTLPLLTFAFGARRISLTTLGVLQYIGPTGMFALGILVYGEPLGLARAATFGLIWAGVALYTVDGAMRLRGLARRADANS
ncbi:EamA family transporter RarD [Fundidesulfovibrio soli]|uniref:EamA family transporter RarD n=1 Tax=Fundidesulfovibrio soli TaxID=2922716 RepID=UPI001FAF435A|nr:EamA family transporter RarD [Fundidesulfovibrio soli]